MVPGCSVSPLEKAFQTLRPLTAFKNAPNLRFVQNLSRGAICSSGFQSGGPNFVKNLLKNTCIFISSRPPLGRCPLGSSKIVRLQDVVLFWGVRSVLLVVRFSLLTVNSVWSFLLAVEIRFGLFCLWRKMGLIFFTYGSSPFSGYWVRYFLFTVPRT